MPLVWVAVVWVIVFCVARYLFKCVCVCPSLCTCAQHNSCNPLTETAVVDVLQGSVPWVQGGNHGNHAASMVWYAHDPNPTPTL